MNHASTKIEYSSLIVFISIEEKPNDVSMDNVVNKQKAAYI